MNLFALPSDIFSIKSIIEIKLNQIYHKFFNKIKDNSYINDLASTHEKLIQSFFDKFAT